MKLMVSFFLEASHVSSRSSETNMSNMSNTNMLNKRCQKTWKNAKDSNENKWSSYHQAVSWDLSDIVIICRELTTVDLFKAKRETKASGAEPKKLSWPLFQNMKLCRHLPSHSLRSEDTVLIYTGRLLKEFTISTNANFSPYKTKIFFIDFLAPLELACTKHNWQKSYNAGTTLISKRSTFKWI